MKPLRAIRLFAFYFLVNPLVLFAQKESEHNVQFSLLRQNDSVAKGGENSIYNTLKFTEIGNNSSISFGGSYRGQFEYFDNEEFSFSPNKENGWYLQRLLLHGDIRLNKNLRVFAELGSSIVESKEELAPVDQDNLYVNQFILYYQIKRLGLRIGRENLKLGSRRLLDPREGPNIRRSFDHFSMELKGSVPDQSYLLFAGSPMQARRGVFDNEMFQNEEWLWGFYTQRIMNFGFNIDAYYLGSHYDIIQYALDTETEMRHSLGIRTWKSFGKWQFDNEAVYQFGSFGNRAIRAWTISFNIYREVNEKNNIGLKTELISGTESENTLGTFNPLYPRGAYFGRVARIGPANLIDIHPYWKYKIGKLSLELDYDVFWRYSNMDAIYGPPMNIVLEGESNSRFIAQQFGTIINYEFSPFAMIEFESNVILPEDYILDVRPGPETLFHMVFTGELRF